MATFSINGKKFEFKGANTINFSNNKIIVNGKELIDLETFTEKEIRVYIQGNLEKLDIKNCNELKIEGNTKNINLTNGNLFCKDILGEVKVENGNIKSVSIAGNCFCENGNIIG